MRPAGTFTYFPKTRLLSRSKDPILGPLVPVKMTLLAAYLSTLAEAALEIGQAQSHEKLPVGLTAVKKP